MTLRFTGECPIPPGTRIELLTMPNDPCPIEAGARGTVLRDWSNESQVNVRWDNGRSLFLIPGVDTYTVVNDDEWPPKGLSCTR
jgi:hypothetical protein